MGIIYKKDNKQMIFAALAILSFLLIQMAIPFVGTVQAANEKSIVFVLNDSQKQMIAANLTDNLPLDTILYSEYEASNHNFSVDPLIFAASVNNSAVEQINNTVNPNTTIVVYDLPPGSEIGTPADANITAYWTYGGEQNLCNMIAYMDNLYFGNSTPVDPPCETETETGHETDSEAESDNAHTIGFVVNDSVRQKSLINATGAVSFNMFIFNETEGVTCNFSNVPVIFLASVNNATVDRINAIADENTTVVVYDPRAGNNFGTAADLNITCYWSYGGDENIQNMLFYMDNLYFGNSTPIDPPLDSEAEPDNAHTISFVVNDSIRQQSLINATGAVSFNMSVFNETEAETYNFCNEPVIFLASVNNATVDLINATADGNATVVVYDLPPGNNFGTAADLNITHYWSYGGDENIQNMLLYMDNLYFGNTTEVNPPEQMNSTRPNIVIIIGGESYVPMYAEAGKHSCANVTVYASKHLPSDLNLSSYDLIFMEMFGAGIDIIEPAVNNATALGIPVAAIHAGKYEYLSTVDMSNYSAVEEYWENSGPENACRLINYLSNSFCGSDAVVNEPILTPKEGIYHPDSEKLFVDLDEYLSWYAANGTYDASKPTIGIVFYDSHYKAGDLGGDQAIFREFEARGVNIIPVYLNYKNPDIIDRFFVKDGSPIIDAVVNIRCFRFYGRAPERGVELLKTYNVPIINALTDYSKTPEEWINSTDGLTTSKIGYSIGMPEIDGQTDFIWVAGRGIDPETESIGFRPITPVDEQVDWLVDRTLALAKLKHKANSQKKVAIIYYNHGGGKNNLGASYLDIVPSLSNLLDEMKTEGYSINGEVPNEDELLDLMLHQGRNVGTWAPEELQSMVNNGDVTLIPAGQYIEWFHELPEEKQTEVKEMWGEPPGDIMVYNDGGSKYLVIPKVSFGNVILTPQPTRGWLQNQDVLYHDKDLPPHHQYIASYFWLRMEFGADALIHFGRHGTLEWLPGKERGLSATDCWPALLLKDCPDIYPYIMDGLGEGTQAKRRGNAVIIDHLTPPVVTAGLYGNYSLIHEKIHSYGTVNSSLKDQYRISITKLYQTMDLESVLDYSPADLENMSENDFAVFINGDLHQYLHKLGEEFIPYGLHIMGESPQGSELVSLVQSMLGEEFKNHVGLLYPEPHELSAAHGNCTVLKALLTEVIINKTSPEIAEEKILGAGNTSEYITADLQTAIAYSNDLTACTIEIPRIINALNGGFIPPNTGGDPVRNPEALPTGNNFHSFDSRIMPTAEAWNVGVQMADEMIAQYQAGHNGAYPEKVAFVLWACEAMRHEGVTESEALYLLGVKPVWSKGKIKGVELIPSVDLGRPRIDVLFTVSGLYRDTFPDKIKLLDKAVRLAAGVDEDPNYVKQNSEALYNSLIEAGYDEETAKSLSMSRIFSSAPGAYGTGMSSAIDSSGTWDDESKLVDLYLSKMGYVYGNDGWGTLEKDLFRKNLGKVKAAVHSRSSNLYGVVDNDDTFQFFGALSLAVRTISGENPEMYIADLRSVDNPRTTTLGEFISTELNARYFNPKWIEGMMEHGYAGARYMDKKFLENLWGWTVTNPDLISDEVWDKVFDVYVNDKYELGLDEFFNSNNPYARQSMMARMLETARKGYWNPEQSVIEKLAREYKKSVEVNGVTCCHHTCGNILLDNYIQSNYKEILHSESVTDSSGDSDDNYKPSNPVAVAELNKTVENEGNSLNSSQFTGYDSQSLQPVSDLPEVGEDSSLSENSNNVQGKVMKEVDQRSSLSDKMGGTPLAAVIIVISIIGIISYGFWFRKQ